MHIVAAAPERYRPKTWIKILFSLGILAYLISVIIIIRIIIIPNQSSIGIVAAIILILIFYRLTIATLPLDITLDQNSVSAAIFGITMKKLIWSQVKEVLVFDLKNAYGQYKRYAILGAGASLAMPAIFAKRISFSELNGSDGLDRLRSVITQIATERQIPIMIRDGSTDEVIEVGNGKRRGFSRIYRV